VNATHIGVAGTNVIYIKRSAINIRRAALPVLSTTTTGAGQRSDRAISGQLFLRLRLTEAVRR
jgi:hypothetical protein